MGWLDRLHDVATASLGALEAPVGFVKDVGVALPEFGQLDLPDFTADVYHAIVTRGSDEANALIGPQGIGGTAIGALPDPVRAGAGAVLGPTQDSMELAYHDLIGRPLSTAITASSIANRTGGFWSGFGDMFRTSTWAEAWNISEHRSPGQSLALAFLTKDVLDPHQTAKAHGTDWYEVLSGTTDAATRLFLDPTALALGGGTSYLKATRAITGEESIARLAANGQLGKFSDYVSQVVAEHGDGAAGVLRHELFPRHPLGPWMADLLANADKLPEGVTGGLSGPAAIDRVTRVLMGATDEIGLVRETRPELAGQIDRLAQRRDMLRGMSLNGFDLANQPDDLSHLESEIDMLHSQESRLERLQASSATLQTLPRTGGAVAARGRFTMGDFYQQSIFAKPLRTVFSMEPHPWVHLDDPTSDISVWRMLQKSALPIEEQMAWRSQFMAAADPVARMGVLHAAEDSAVASLAEKAGMSRDELNAVLADAKRGRSMTKRALDSRAYDGEGRSVVTLEGEDGVLNQHHIMEYPLYETQLPNLAPIVDMDEVEKALSPIRNFTRRIPGHEIPPELVKNFGAIWKPAVLLRIGFPVRFLTDESLRSMAKIGVLSTMKNLGHGGRDAVGATLEKIGFSPREIENLTLGGHQFEGAFGAPGDGANIYRKLIEARESFGTLISADEGKILDQLIQSGPWRSVQPTETAYANAWEHAVNKQIGQSKLGARMLHDMSTPLERIAEPVEGGRGFERLPMRSRDDVIARTADWLRNDPEGRALAKQLPVRKDLEKWVGSAYDQIDSYLPNDELKAAAWGGIATHDQLVALMPNAADRPIVHGGIVDQAMGTSAIGRTWRKFVDTGMRNLVGKPSNVLIRNPFFDHTYQAEVRRQVELLTGEREASLPQRMLKVVKGEPSGASSATRSLTEEEIQQVQFRARRYAMSQTKDLFHNFAEEPTLAHTLGFLSPFYTAWSQILGRWGGIAVDNPAFMRRLQIVWRSPERMGLVTDGVGNVLDENDRIATPVEGGGFKVGGPAADSERNVTLHLPEWAKDVPGLKNVGEFEFGKDSLNLILHGLPPVGPIVQVAANEIAKSRPELEDSLHWALPYGTTQNSIDILKPTLVRRLQTTAEGDANRSYAYTAMRIYTDKMIDYNLGKRAKPPDWKEAESDAQAFWKMRTVASFTLPVTPQFTSPYQHYIDSYRARRDLDGKMTPEQRQAPGYQTPDEWFLDKYGDEFFPIVASMSKSIDGIPPTLEGAQVHAQYADILAKYPELGRLISGEQGAGTFSRSVYEAQFRNRVGPGSSQTERVVRPFEEYRTEASRELGWIQFGRVMDTLDALRVQRGLPSFAVKGAADLLAAKQAAVAFLANDPKYAGWYEDYAASDATTWDRKIAGMTAIVNQKGLEERPEFQGLKKYLAGRAAIVGALTEVQKSNLHTQANADLVSSWEAYVGTLVDENPAFAALYNRWLQNDPVNVTPITAAAQAGELPV